MPSPSVSKAIRYVEPLLLDAVKGSEAAYSLRKLSRIATKAIRVRRSVDNAETDIGFSGKELDTASLLAFCGAGSGFVTTWYDQVGTKNATQATSSKQPIIVNGGLLITGNNLPSIKGINANSTELTTPATFSYNALQTHVVGRFGASTRAFYQFGAINTNGNLFAVAGTVYSRLTNIPETATLVTNTSYITNAAIYSATYTGDLRRVWVNNTVGTDNSNSVTLNANNTACTLFSITGASYYNDGDNQEFIFFTSIDDTVRKKIEKSQSKYYGITLA